jgi:hypothetical protein
MAVVDLTTLANVEAWLGLTVGADPTADALLSRLITAASTYFQQYCSREFALTSYAETRSGLGGSRMMLFNTPVASVSSLTIDGVAIPARSPLTQTSSTTPDGYVNDDLSVMVTGWFRFNRGYNNIAVNYTAGYSPIPFDLEQACIDTVGDWFRYRTRIGKLDEAIEGQSIRFTNTDLPVRAKSVLYTYKRVAPIY